MTLRFFFSKISQDNFLGFFLFVSHQHLFKFYSITYYLLFYFFPHVYFSIFSKHYIQRSFFSVTAIYRFLSITVREKNFRLHFRYDVRHRQEINLRLNFKNGEMADVKTNKWQKKFRSCRFFSII